MFTTGQIFFKIFFFFKTHLWRCCTTATLATWSRQLFILFLYSTEKWCYLIIWFGFSKHLFEFLEIGTWCPLLELISVILFYLSRISSTTEGPIEYVFTDSRCRCLIPHIISFTNFILLLNIFQRILTTTVLCVIHCTLLLSPFILCFLFSIHPNLE